MLAILVSLALLIVLTFRKINIVVVGIAAAAVMALLAGGDRSHRYLYDRGRPICEGQLPALLFQRPVRKGHGGDRGGCLHCQILG